MRRFSLSIVCLIGLSACTEDAYKVPATPSDIPVSASAGPGEKLMQPYDAGVIFADTCLIRGPAFEEALEGVRVHNMTRDAQTGTFYHNSKNLSVKVTPKSCSLVFATNVAVDAAVSGLAKGTASVTPNPPRTISVTSQVLGDGLRYFRLGIKAPVGQSS